MSKIITISRKIKKYQKQITVEGDKSLSIRWALMASLATGKSKAFNLLNSDDVLSTLSCIKKLGIKVKKNKDFCEIYGKGLHGYKFKKNLVLNAGNSGTLGRLILGTIINSPYKIKLSGDKSLSKRDFSRISTPLKKIGVNFYPSNKKNLPFFIKGSNNLTPINYLETRGSAQCKSAIMLAALNIQGKTTIQAKKSRDHTEILYKFLKIPIKVKKTKNYDLIEITGGRNFSSFNYTIPSDVSSASFFVVLTLLTKDSKLLIKNININPSRIGLIKILNKMGAKIVFQNKKIHNGEHVADILVKSIKKIKPINCPKELNSSAIDEFLIIFLVAAKANGNSYFRDLAELDQKESPRLKLGSKILNMMGIKTDLTKKSLRIYGNPYLNLNDQYIIKDYLKDHRIFMMATIAALSFGGKWKIHDSDSIKTSFPSFLKIIKNLGATIN